MNDQLNESDTTRPEGAARSDVEAFLTAQLQPERFKDYGPNGLQVEGARRVCKIASGVTASRAFIESAAAEGADTLLVHHGLFWRGHDGRLTGWLRERVALLMHHGLNLLAYHLPLDAHPQWGNNAQLGQRLGLRTTGRFGDQDLGFVGELPVPVSLSEWQAQLEALTGRGVTIVEGSGRPLRRVGWCTGGAQGYFEAAIAAGVDAFVTGEISEPQAHLARETGVAFVAAGHHATERYGAPALGAAVAQHFGLAHCVIEVPNPA